MNRTFRTLLILAGLALLAAACSIAAAVPFFSPSANPVESSPVMENVSIPGVPPEAVTLFAANCTACHGPAGEGSTIAPPLNSEELRGRLDDAEIAATITNGRPGTAMPAWGGQLSDEQIGALVALVRHWGELDDAQLAQIAEQADDCGGLTMHPGMGPMMGPMMGGGCDAGSPWWFPFGR